MKKQKSRAFTILELLISMFLVAILMGPILNTFQVSEKLSRRGSKAFNAQNLAREMMGEIAKKSFDDPYQASTINVNLKPGPTHEEYLPDASAPKIANGTEEVGGVEKPRLLNETLVNRSKYYNDIDDYADYNTDETILPTLSNGSEYIVDGENPYEKLRVKVEVRSNTSGAQQPEEVLQNGATLGNDPKGLAITADGKYAAVINAADKTMSMINLQTGYEVDCGPNGSGLSTLAGTPCSNLVNRIPLSYVSELPKGNSYNLGEPTQVITGPSGDRFYVLHKAGILDPDKYSGVSVIDMNPHNTPEVSFHKVYDTNLISKDLRSNSINSIVVDRDGIVYAATNGGGLSRSSDNGETWKLQKLLLADGTTMADTIYCLASVKQGYGTGDNKYVYAGGKGGLWISKNDGPWNRVGTVGSANITAIAANDNGYVVAGPDNGFVYLSKEYDLNFTQKNGPAAQKINTLAIDDNYRVWAGNDTGQFYSENLFQSATVSWTSHLPAGVTSAKVNSIYIDRSRTYPAPFTKVLNRDTNPVPSNAACPSLHASETGLHLFYLDDSGEVGAGTATAFDNPKLWYVNSPDFGKTWGTPQKISKTPAGKTAWAHSETIDKRGVIHVVWQDNRAVADNHWQIYYQRSEDGGKTWLSTDICIGNEDDTLGAIGINYKSGTFDGWVKAGSHWVRQIAVSSDNKVFVTFTNGSSFHYLRYSNDGGKTWPAENFEKISVTAGVPVELVESIDVIEPLNKLMLILITGSIGNDRKMIFTDLNGKSIITNPNFIINDANRSSNAVFNEEGKLFYFRQFLDGSFYNIFQTYSNYPYQQFPENMIPAYTQFSQNKIQRKQFWQYPINVREIYPPVCFQNEVFTFFASSAIGSISSPRYILLKKSDNSGISFCEPIFIDNIYNSFDSATTARYGNNVFLIKRTASASPTSNFHLTSFSSNTGFSCTNDYLYSFNTENVPIKSFNSYNFPGEKINCFSSDNSGNMLYGTSSGLYFRNINFPNTLLWTPPSCHSLINYPPKFEDNKWRHFFKGVRINSLFVENNGVWWVGTANMGIFRTNDYGENWSQIEAILSTIDGSINFIGKGSAINLNMLSFETSRYNLQNPDVLNPVIPEKLFSCYNLLTNKIQNVTLVTKGQYKNLVALSQYSYDNSKIATYDGLQKKFYINKANNEYMHSLEAGSSKNLPSTSGESDYLNTGIYLNKNNTIEIFASRKFSANRCMSGLFTLPGDNDYSYGILNLKINETTQKCYQYFNDLIPGDGQLIFFLNPIEPFNTWKGNVGYCLIRTVISYFPFIIDASSKMNSNVNNAFAAPDNKTIYFTNYTDGKVYSVFDINDTSSIQIKEYSENIINPIGIIFSPKNRNGEFKTYVVCPTNIVDLHGNKLLPEISGINISGAAISDNGDIFFVDKNKKNIFKCVNSAEKTVYVTVKEADDSVAGSMPPITLVRKFHNWQAANELRRGYLPNRNYLKYEFNYTSQKYPGGISASQSVVWSPQKPGTYDTLNSYIVDGVLEVNGTLEIAAGTVVKFASADKLVNLTSWSGKAKSCIKVNAGGKLIVAGGLKESDHVIFTSLDDNTIAPSAYTTGDLLSLSDSGLPNVQLIRTKPMDPTPYCGVKYGDWGGSDGTPANSFGGIYLANSGCAEINNLELKYGLIYTKSIYPGGTMPPNFNTASGINEWSKTNVYVVNDTLEIANQTRLDIKQGAIVKFHTNTGLSFKNNSADNYPSYSVIADGSPDSRIIFSHACYANATEEGASGPGPEGDTPNVDSDGNWYGITAAGMPDMANFKNVQFRSDAKSYLNLSGSGFNFSNCGFGNASSSTNAFSISLMQFDTSKFHGSLFRSRENAIKLSDNSVNSFASSRFTYNSTSTSDGSFIISAASEAVVLMKDNVIAHTDASNIPLSKISLRSSGYFFDNHFLGVPAAGNSAFAASCEINIFASPDKPILPVIQNNYFENCRHAIYIRGAGYDTTSAFLDNRIVNNKFVRCGEILRSEVSMDNDFVKTPTNAALDADGNVYMTDAHTDCVYKYSPNGNQLLKFGGAGTGDAQFDAPAAIAINDTGEIYVVDQANKRVQKFDRDGKYILQFRTDIVDPTDPNAPAGITISTTATTETIFVTDQVRNTVMRFTNIGEFRGEISTASSLTPPDFSTPGGLVASKDSEFLYVTDTDNNRVVKIKLNLTTAEVEFGDNYFDIEPRYFDINNDLATWPLGFAPDGSVEEGGHIELNVTAKKGDGSVNTAYTGTSATGKIYIDPTVGLVTWEGAGITDLAADNSNNGAEYGLTVTTFTNGIAKFYVRNTMQAAALKITIVDTTNTEMKGEAEVSWTAENTPPALEFIGANSKGFRKFICRNDPSVTFIKIPASAFDRGDGTYGGAPTEIKLSTYYIAETLTTNAQFNNWRNSAGTPALVGAWASNSGLSSYSNHPAICLQKDDARNYSYWLITGSNSGQNEMYHASADQHEKASRGAKLNGVGNNAAEKTWPWGNTWNTSNCNENSVQTPDERIFIGLSGVANGTTRVTRYPEMGYYGLRDITGNCWVWLRDNANLVTGGSWFNGGLGDFSYRCSFTSSHSTGYLGGKWDSVRPCFYWPLQ